MCPSVPTPTATPQGQRTLFQIGNKKTSFIVNVKLRHVLPLLRVWFESYIRRNYGICNSGVSFAERFHARIQFFVVTWSYVFAHFYASFGKRRLRTVGQNARRRLPSIRRGVVRCGNFCRIFPHQANHERTNNRAFVVGLRCGRLAIKSKMYFCGKMFVFAYKKLRTKP